MDNEKRLVRVYKKVEVQEVYVFEVPKQEYKSLGTKDNEGNTEYGYVTVPNQYSKEETSEVLYEQKFDENELNTKDLALYLNRVK